MRSEHQYSKPTINSSSMMMPSDQMSHFSPEDSLGEDNSTSGARYRGDLIVYTMRKCMAEYRDSPNRKIDSFTIISYVVETIVV